ncbi:unnamed protein product [Mytilus coruscus]|uniref:Uncharacterized protein n=1 Tax=Mytilus coruscus TaxID=42192 RepID=A0A6J8DSQ5_MYTCO|nr:unnamed protein product [Mytilus coruscus]
MTSHKDTDKKERMWLEKAELGKSVLVLKTWYSSMSTRYGRLKKKSGDGDKELTERDDWVIRNFDFLHPHVHEVQKKTLVSVNEEEITSSWKLCFDETPGDMPSILKRTGLKAKAHKHTHDTSETEDVLLAGIEDRSNKMMVLQQQVLERLRPVSSDRERDACVDWIRTVITEIDHVVWRRCQQDISNTHYRYIAENDQIKRAQSVPTPVIQPQLRQQMQPLQAPFSSYSASWQTFQTRIQTMFRHNTMYLN